ncbi:MAG: protein kinase, partial [Bacteroidota bacterium]
MLATETKPLFEGNNSTVYFQERSAYETPVVIKVARDDHASPAQIAAFDNEYAITRDLNLKAIRRVYDKIEFEGRKALVMEYIPGKTIKEHFRGKKITLKEFLPLAIKICDALGEIHQVKIIHKDIDSKNILITEEGDIKIIDFGLSTRLSVKSHNLGNQNIFAVDVLVDNFHLMNFS